MSGSTSDRLGRRLAAVGHAALIACWVWLSVPVLGWLARTVTDPARRTNVVLLAVLAALLASKLPGALRRAAFDPHRPPRMGLGPVALLAACALGQWYLDLQVARAACFVLGSWGLLGLYVPPAVWRRGLAPALAAAAMLPAGGHLDAFLGVPARIATARVVQALLAPLGVPVQSSEAVLVLENGVADVDLPCSGVKGLWVGAIFFLCLTFVERRAIGWRWLMAAAIYLAALLAANLVRVLVLTSVTFVAAAPRAAALLHLPLGVAGFAAASVAAVLALRRLARRSDDEPNAAAAAAGPASGATAAARVRAWVPAMALAGALAALALGRAPGPSRAAVAAAALPRLPPAVGLSPLPLDAREEELFGRHAALVAGKWRLSEGAHRGALLVVIAESYVAHHAPEICLAGSGRRVDGVTPAEVEAGFPVRVVGIDGGRSAAIYWFQSRSAVTGALLERTLAEVTGRERRWALVSVLLEGWSPAELGGAQALLRQIRAAVAEALGSPADGGPQEIHEEARQETQQETHEETHRETHQAKTERRAT